MATLSSITSTARLIYSTLDTVVSFGIGGHKYRVQIYNRLSEPIKPILVVNHNGKVVTPLSKSDIPPGGDDELVVDKRTMSAKGAIGMVIFQVGSSDTRVGTVWHRPYAGAGKVGTFVGHSRSAEVLDVNVAKHYAGEKVRHRDELSLTENFGVRVTGRHFKDKTLMAFVVEAAPGKAGAGAGAATAVATGAPVTAAVDKEVAKIRALPNPYPGAQHHYTLHLCNLTDSMFRLVRFENHNGKCEHRFSDTVRAGHTTTAVVDKRSWSAKGAIGMAVFKVEGGVSAVGAVWHKSHHGDPLVGTWVGTTSDLVATSQGVCKAYAGESGRHERVTSVTTGPTGGFKITGHLFESTLRMLYVIEKA